MSTVTQNFAQILIHNLISLVLFFKEYLFITKGVIIVTYRMNFSLKMNKKEVNIYIYIYHPITYFKQNYEQINFIC